MDENKEGILFLIPHFHCDVAHLKTREEALELSCGHIPGVLYLLKAHDDYRFALDQDVLAKSFLERYPEQKDLLLEMMKKNRLEIICGMYVMVDVNIPSGESFVGQLLVAKANGRQNLEVNTIIDWMPDTFGHHPQIPQLMRKAGFEYYCFARGVSKTRNSKFLWEGTDGTRILAHWMPYGYGSHTCLYLKI